MRAVSDFDFLFRHRIEFGKHSTGIERISLGLNNTIIVRIHRAPHLLRCRALEVQKYVCAPDALHLRHPVNAYNLGGMKRIGLCNP